MNFIEISFTFYRANGQWKVVKTDVEKSVIKETRNNVTKAFSQLDFYMYMKRRYQFYNTNVMLPIILSSFLVTLVFVVPADSGEKLSYILTVLLTIAVFLTIIGETLPAVSNTTSILGKCNLSRGMRFPTMWHFDKCGLRPDCAAPFQVLKFQMMCSQ